MKKPTPKQLETLIAILSLADVLRAAAGDSAGPMGEPS